MACMVEGVEVVYLKKCPHCGETKPLTEFDRARHRYGGHKSWCKACTRERNKQYYLAHHATVLERAKSRPKKSRPTKWKLCSRCGRSLSLQSFYRNKRHKDGLQNWCKMCTKQHHKMRYRERKHSGQLYHELHDRCPSCGGEKHIQSNICQTYNLKILHSMPHTWATNKPRCPECGTFLPRSGVCQHCAAPA